MTSLFQKEICDLTLSKQTNLIMKYHQVAKKFLLLFSLLQTSQMKRESSMFNRKSRSKLLNRLNTCNNIPSKIKQEIGSYDLIHATKTTIDRFSKVYTKYSLKRATVNGWKERCKKNDLQSIGKRGRPNLMDGEMLKKIKDVIIGSRLSSRVIS